MLHLSQSVAEKGDIFVTATGCRDVITQRHFLKLKDGAILCNSGHFNVEVDVAGLEKIAVGREEGRSELVKGYVLPNGRTVFVLSEGRLVNLASGDGHPVEIMDMSFAIQALGARYIADHRESLETKCIEIPDEIDYDVARRRLAASGMEIDTLTPEQEKYLRSWEI